MAQKASREELLEELHRLDAITDNAPRLKDLREHGNYSKMPFERVFGGWTNALKEAGIKGGKKESISKDDLLHELERLTSELGKTPTRKEMHDKGKYSRSPYERVFGSWNNALEAANLESNKGRKKNKTELVDTLQSVASELGEVPTQRQFNEFAPHSVRPYHRVFGSWNEALEAAELEPNKEHDVEYPTLVCEVCGDEYTKKPSLAEQSRFCSNQCKNKIKESWIGEKNPHPNAGVRVTVECEWCGDDIEVPPSEEESTRFCSRQCLGQHHKDVRSGEDHPRFNEDATDYRGPNWEEQREKAIQRDGEQCVGCGMTREESREMYGEDLTVHHKVRFHDFDDYKEANKLPNLMTVCNECHGLYEHLPVTPQ